MLINAQWFVCVCVSYWHTINPGIVEIVMDASDASFISVGKNYVSNWDEAFSLHCDVTGLQTDLKTGEMLG